jgi:hypothetical protein
MDSLISWARKWNISPEALRELCAQSITVSYDDEEKKGEARIQSEIRLEAAGKGYFLYRNNRGAGKLSNGSFVRWGLANDSEKLGDKWKSGDLIGWKTRFITEADVGSYLAQFVSIEVKAADWKFSGNADELAQVQWATLVNANGGVAMLVNCTGKL